MKRTSIILLFSAAAVGCSDKLETGYQPKKLGVTDAERRAYYAPAFSPEAAAAQEGRENAAKIRRPTGY